MKKRKNAVTTKKLNNGTWSHVSCKRKPIPTKKHKKIVDEVFNNYLLNTY